MARCHVCGIEAEESERPEPGQVCADRDSERLICPDCYAAREERERERATQEKTVRCQCGEADHDGACEWTGPRRETVIVEWMPREYRSSHDAAGADGCPPCNGAVRLRCERSCAERLVEDSPDWARIVG